MHMLSVCQRHVEHPGTHAITQMLFEWIRRHSYSFISLIRSDWKTFKKISCSFKAANMLQLLYNNCTVSIFMEIVEMIEYQTLHCVCVCVCMQ